MQTGKYRRDREYLCVGVKMRFVNEWFGQIWQQIKSFLRLCRMYSNSFLEKLDVINKFQMDKPMVWYRGQSNHTYKLHSSLFRMNFRNLDDFILTEQSYYNMCRVSLYFAALNWNPEKADCTVWLLDPLRLNDKFVPGFGLYIPKPHESYQNLLYHHGEMFEFGLNSVALFPRRNNPRLIAQQGTFTLQGNTTLSLEQEYGGTLFKEGIIGRVDFSIEDFSDIKSYLRLNGINHFSLFPDLDGLAKFLTNEDSKYISQVSQEVPDFT
jgi:hypothetical protein